MPSVEDFVFDRILSNEIDQKFIWILGSIKGDTKNKALLQLLKTEF